MNGSNKKNNEQRLQKYLASCGVASRRTCEEIISQGRVGVNGSTVTQPGIKVSPGDIITVDGKEVIPEKKFYFILHKPKGYLSSNYDPHHMQYARDLIDIPEKHLLFHVGRLDLYSTGLMIYTNDGEFANRLQHPSFEVEKEYFIQTREKISENDMKLCLRGVQLNGGIVYKVNRYTFVSDRKVMLILTEGKNREIRNIFDHFGYTIEILHRIRIGIIHLGDLAPGRYKEINRDVVRRVMTYVGKRNNTWL